MTYVCGFKVCSLELTPDPGGSIVLSIAMTSGSFRASVLMGYDLSGKYSNCAADKGVLSGLEFLSLIVLMINNSHQSVLIRPKDRVPCRCLTYSEVWPNGVACVPTM